MSPYITFALAMCAIVFLALAGTAYMAVYFNRRAKADLQVALEPLAEVISGDVDLDEASVSGRYRGHIAQGSVSTLPGGMGRVFHTSLIDGAGGERWQSTLTRSKEPGVSPKVEAENVPEGLAEQLEPTLMMLEADPALADVWFRLEYDPEPGHIRLTRPMKTRRDIPSGESFQRFYETLVVVANANRAEQGPESKPST
jgi:hypothetical protein